MVIRSPQSIPRVALVRHQEKPGVTPCYHKPQAAAGRRFGLPDCFRKPAGSARLKLFALSRRRPRPQRTAAPKLLSDGRGHGVPRRPNYLLMAAAPARHSIQTGARTTCRGTQIGLANCFSKTRRMAGRGPIGPGKTTFENPLVPPVTSVLDWRARRPRPRCVTASKWCAHGVPRHPNWQIAFESLLIRPITSFWPGAPGPRPRRAAASKIDLGAHLIPQERVAPSRSNSWERLRNGRALSWTGNAPKGARKGGSGRAIPPLPNSDYLEFRAGDRCQTAAHAQPIPRRR